ncbi:MAG: hypothetical protein ACXVZV_00795 [Terriglobales bacterium]
MFRALSRLLPAYNAFPTPGQDISGTEWQQLMRPGEIALFCIDSRTGQPLRIFTADPPKVPMHHHCSVFRSLYHARLAVKGCRMSRPNTSYLLYDKGGRWLETHSPAGVDRRNPGLGLALLMLHYPAMALIGTLLVLAVSTWLRPTHPELYIDWRELSPQQWVSWTFVGTGVGALLWAVGYGIRLVITWYIISPATQPLGSPKRDRFYRQLARAPKPHNPLVPLHITFERKSFEWPSLEKHTEWSTALHRDGFEPLGQYLIPEIKTELELWLNRSEGLMACIANHPLKGMWVDVFARYADGRSMTAVNKNGHGLDPHPKRRIDYIGPQATAEHVIQHARSNFGAEGRLHPTEPQVIEGFKKNWTEYVQWRRERGTTAEEYKRVAHIRAAEKTAGQ